METEAKLSDRLYDALHLAFELHGHDARKSTNIPVLTHLLNVSALVQQDGGNEDEAIAALLHDSLEDHPDQVTRAGLELRFGDRVRSIIEHCTDTPVEYLGGEKPDWESRKHAYIEHVRHADPTLLRVTIADKVDNVRAIIRDFEFEGDEVWKRFNRGKELQLWYYQSVLAAYHEAGARTRLLDELDTLLPELAKCVEKT